MRANGKNTALYSDQSRSSTTSNLRLIVVAVLACNNQSFLRDIFGFKLASITKFQHVPDGLPFYRVA